MDLKLFLMVFVIAAIFSTLTNESLASDSEDEGTDLQNNDKDVVPKAKLVRSCKIQINELFLGKGTEESMQFIELRRFCPKNIQQPKTKTLAGHFLVALDLGPPTKILLILDYKGESLSVVKENIDDGEDGEIEIESVLHVTGTASTPEKSLTFVKREMRRQKKMQFVSHPNLHKILPTAAESNNPIALLLIYYMHNERIGIPIDALQLGFYTDSNNVIRYFDHIIDDDQIAALKNRIEDFIIYGHKTTTHANEFMRNLLNDETFDINNQIIIINPNLDITMSSYSRCDNKLKDNKVFDLTDPTPFKANKCTRDRYKPPYNFRGHGVTSDGQRIGINVLHFVRHYHKKIDKLNLDPTTLTSQMIGVHPTVLREFVRRHRGNRIETPGRKRKVKNWKQLQVDSFDRDVIRSIIAGYYKNNTAPFFSDIFTQFKNYKKDNCVSYTTSDMGAAPTRWLPMCCDDEIGSNENEEDPNNSQTSATPCTPMRHVVSINEGFSIGSITFAAVLKDMGFHFGRIDNRVAILLRQDIIASRGRFLRILRENNARDIPYKITYLDETWIDPNQKSKKGWTLKKPTTMREKEKYAYGRLKIGHGPRVIALAAGDDDGIIKESVLVYKVKKNANVLDYHENINKEGFIKWFKDLLELWKTKNQKHVIVMDNAPYHSSLLIPKNSQKKAVLYEWLEKIKNDQRYNVDVPLNPRLRKWELWQMIQSLKKKPELQNEIYELDRLIAAEGHIIARLPPYQCELNAIEFAWGVVKREVSKRNLRQNVDEIVAIAKSVLENYDETAWKNSVKHVKKLGEKYWEEDGFMDREVELDAIIIPLGNDDDDNDDDYEHLGNVCDRSGTEHMDIDFDPEELEREWQRDRQNVDTFHQQTSFYPNPPPIQPRQLFDDDDE